MAILPPYSANDLRSARPSVPPPNSAATWAAMLNGCGTPLLGAFNPSHPALTPRGETCAVRCRLPGFRTSSSGHAAPLTNSQAASWMQAPRLHR
jgi:hypothetical protein